MEKGKKQRKATVASREVDPYSLLSQAVSAIGVPDSAKFLGYLRARQWKNFTDRASDACHSAVQSGDIDSYRKYSTLAALVSKNESLISDESLTERAALDSWWRSERDCARANRRLALTTRGIVGTQYIGILNRAKRIVARILGEVHLSEIERSVRHGPGVVLGCRGLATSPAFKYAAGTYTVTPSCAGLFSHIVSTDPIWSTVCFNHSTRMEVVPDCEELAFVFKNWKTKRSISIGALGNLYCQLGIGTVIARRLRRVGIDIKDQRNNQKAARQASTLEGVYGDGYVTLDLARASDSICTGLVKMLLPEFWYRLLNCTRTSCTMLPDGSVRRLSKFSAMGNGFTFPLETLIFYALAQATLAETRHKARVWVYGDDIIVPRGSALLLIEVLRWCGFSLNNDKSFIHGGFYESCGADFLDGHPVRPFYWKRALRRFGDFAILLNGYRRYAKLLPDRAWVNSLCAVFSSAIRGRVLYGPSPKGDDEQLVDTHLITDDPSKYTTRVVDGIKQVKVYQDLPLTRSVNDDFAYLAHSHGLVDGDEVGVSPGNVGPLFHWVHTLRNFSFLSAQDELLARKYGDELVNDARAASCRQTRRRVAWMCIP